MLPSLSQTFLTSLAVSFVCIAAGVLIERRWPAGRRSAEGTLFNSLYATPVIFLQVMSRPLEAAGMTHAVNLTGGGLIVLPSKGWGLLLGFVIYALALDLGEYLFHRAQHSIPTLWVMHSLHHSDENFNVSTTTRHHWAEFLMKAATIYLAVGILFKVNVTILGVYSLVSFYNYISHMNIDLGFGRYSFLLNSPRFHRLHHSRLAQHFDKNFAALFPIYDVIFGTYMNPVKGECPPTGLDSHEAPASLIGAYAWPLGRRPRTAPGQGSAGRPLEPSLADARQQTPA
jgi:sterol desaturase/sphingolipid hydroxylase (fatty acid hydroxylase superfamily)